MLDGAYYWSILIADPIISATLTFVILYFILKVKPFARDDDPSKRLYLQVDMPGTAECGVFILGTLCSGEPTGYGQI